MSTIPTDGVPVPRGRGVGENPANRFERLHARVDDKERETGQVQTVLYRDTSRSILSKNGSPDLPFRYSLNPYRGCEHGCPYCYARPSHEYLGFSAGLDFETRLMVKEDAPKLLAKALQKKSWHPDTIVISGNTDPYQPIERGLKITRGCLRVLARHRNPAAMITKNALITRDKDHLAELARFGAAAATISLTTLRNDIAGLMEPRSSRPAARLRAVEALAEAGVPVGVNLAPLIPGLTDEELPALLRAAADAGAHYAGYMIVRLPGPVEDLFKTWVRRHFPDRYDKIFHRIESLRDGNVGESRFGHRFRLHGPWADVLDQSFRANTKKLGLNKRIYRLETRHFRRLRGGQRELF